MPRVALITGASRGIGAAAARRLAADGFQVVVNHRASGEQADAVVAEIVQANGQAVAIQADVTCEADVSAMIEGVAQRWGGVDVLVHNALIPFAVTSFAELTWNQLGGKLNAELHAAYLLTKAVTPYMISRGHGRLIYMSTGLSRRPREGMITLGTAKAALDQFVRYIAQELAPHGLTANLVAPATVAGTAVTEKLKPGAVEGLSAAAPAGRLVTPEEVAHTIAFFASDGSSFTTGHYLPVNGGLAMD
ncbi:short-chain dehydrogenase [Mycobacterium sp. 852013-50091_SCH5140682]|uniref:SDR family oxidoreductase n=1 Tax=Mycobacterium sp. 852013-50091_SCH5140682 TaxID=1834109 RepID=UPI0007EA1D40|nr:SDR family oxidoreductase [Mycobacterium sp. 852013-50091_SCH5140682]OBC00132.1 short-chain dehydrogenase [Mycobacterium sp. 852013-50091_SCH5140682]